ncbi:LysM domain receptor-like kinase 4 [Linum grandiflorum]
MDQQFLFNCWFLLLLSSVPKLVCQQKYSGNSALDCDGKDAAGPSPAFLYTCNGHKSSCKAFLIYKSQPPYNTLSRISKLTSSDCSELSRINNVSDSTRVLPTGQEVAVPVSCSCTGLYYQANSSYIAQETDSYFKIANDTYEGLSTCNMLLRENTVVESDLQAGQRIQVPLRCACPTRNQTIEGTEFLLTYLIDWGDKVSNISQRFNASVKNLYYANEFEEDDPTIFPFTTILIPLSSEPISSQTIIHHPPSSHTPSVVPLNPLKWKIRKPINRYIWWIVLGMSFALVSLILTGALLVYHKRKGLETLKGKDRKKKLILPEDFLDSMSTVDQGLRIYDLKELKLATADFSAENRLSERVYKGVINGQEVAIKKMSRNVSGEVNLLRKINHFNLISLVAAYEHRGEYYLIYKYMENGSLKDWLQKGSLHEVLSWSPRLQIALDIANGLHYLHNFTEPPYVHKDISSSNILLDADLRAKIANFSLARSAEAVLYPSSSIRLAKGTKGYLAPEYLEYGLVIPEIDVYAFGVVLTELITRKEAVFWQDEREVLLSEAIMKIVDGEDSESELCNFIDPSLHPKQKMSFVLRMVRLVLMCLAKEPEDRPSMGEIVSSLSKIQLEVYRSDFMQCSSS